MEIAATITGYIFIFAACVVVIGVGVYWTLWLIMDGMGVRKVFLQMKRERDDARKELREMKKYTRRLKYVADADFEE